MIFMFSSKGCRYLKKACCLLYHNRSLSLPLSPSLSLSPSLAATCYNSSGSRLILSQMFANISYKLVMPGTLTGITHVLTVYLNNKVLTAHLSLSHMKM